MSELVVQKVLRTLHATSVVVLSVIKLDLALGSLDIGDEVHEMALFQSRLILHVGTDPLHGSKVAQVAILGKSGGKSFVDAKKCCLGNLMFIAKTVPGKIVKKMV